MGTHNTDVKWENDEKSRIRIRKSVARIHNAVTVHNYSMEIIAHQ
jgi:hypothetical protein